MDQATVIFAAVGITAAAATGITAWALSRRTPKLSSTPTFLKPTLLKATGPITAQQAVTLARTAIAKHTPPGELRGLSSGPDLNAQASSNRWTVIFETHDAQRTAIVCFSPSTSVPALVARVEILPTPPQPGQPLAQFFEDSPAALERILASGADFGSKATLSVRPDANGNPAWRLEVRGKVYETPFIEAA